MVVDMSVRNGDAEIQPLLADSAGTGPARTRSGKQWLILIVCGVLVLAAEFGFYLSQAPQTAIFERIICRSYGLDSRGLVNATSAADPCKSELVQGELATILGYKDTFDVLPSMLALFDTSRLLIVGIGILLSLPYGVLSDHWGRKPVLYLGIIGIMLGEIWHRVVCT